jgi:hypothetical protein
MRISRTLNRWSFIEPRLIRYEMNCKRQSFINKRVLYCLYTTTSSSEHTYDYQWTRGVQGVPDVHRVDRFYVIILLTCVLKSVRLYKNTRYHFKV